MQKECISKNWLLSVNRGEYKEINLPNDYAITQPRNPNAPGGASNGYFNGGVGSYNKYLKLQENQHYILNIDGAYMCAAIDINENRIAMHPYGYTPFLVDITDKIRAGKTNKIHITTNDMQPSTRWYSGAGIYRDVYLWTGGSVRVEPWDVFIKTISADKSSATIEVSYWITADQDADATVKLRLDDGTQAEINASVVKAEKTFVSALLEVKNPKLWDLENPNLYTVHTEIEVDGAVCDTADNSFGIRTICYSVENGFQLNGKTVKMRGGCIHHDHGALGVAAFPAAEERKISRLKAVGFNAIRASHYPLSSAMLAACDRLGILVMDEAFDMWNREKNVNDYHLWFADWWARDISYMVQRDRNHPCVVSYSTGNEISERDGSSDGAKWSALLADEIRKYDATRPVTSAICCIWNNFDQTEPEDYITDTTTEGLDDKTMDRTHEGAWGKLTLDYSAPLDIVGYNYLHNRIAEDQKTYPNRIIWNSETWALTFYDSWKAVMENSHVVGDFCWTAYDNLGEAGTGRALWARDGLIPGISLAEYPWRTCYQGDLDLCGYRRPQSYFREAICIGNTEPHIFTTHPEHTGESFSGTQWHWYDVHETWTFDEKYIGRPVRCETYTDADSIDWYLNGEKVGSSIPEKAIAAITLPYEPGEITAVAIKEKKEASRYTLKTTGKPKYIDVIAEKEEIIADERDLAYFEIAIRDGAGNLIPEADMELRCKVTGGTLLGFFSGNPCNEDDYTSKICHAFEGRALAVVSAKEAGTINITVYSDSLAGSSETIKAI